MTQPTNTMRAGSQRVGTYPRSVKGTFRTVKWAVLVTAYGFYFMLPWLRWARDSGPSQAVLFDLQGRRFYVFDLVVHPQDIFWLAGLLVVAALLLFCVTGIAGRVFCGYFCFQTLWTDVFLLVERLVQGERPARIRLDQAPWAWTKVWKKALTHLLWLAAAFATGLSFVLYWGNAPTLILELFTGQAPFPAYATALFLTATTYVMAGIAREQVCTYMCPYARFQSAMFDPDTLIVAYDGKRGEAQKGRGKLFKGLKDREERNAVGVGDCVDCGYCVQVCPTGIDIRDGLQLECISCALCVDACDTIMDSLRWPRGLVGYTSERVQGGNRPRILRPKTIAYGLVLAMAIGGLVASVASRVPLEMSVSQVRQPLYVLLSDGAIQNRYELKLNNKTQQELHLRVAIRGLSGAELDLGRFDDLTLAPEQSLRVMARLRRQPPMITEQQTAFSFEILPLNVDNFPAVAQRAQFSTPEPRNGGVR